MGEAGLEQQGETIEQGLSESGIVVDMQDVALWKQKVAKQRIAELSKPKMDLEAGLEQQSETVEQGLSESGMAVDMQDSEALSHVDDVAFWKQRVAELSKPTSAFLEG